MPKMKIKKGDNVVVITGRDKGKAGEVLRVLPGPMAELRIVIREGRHRQVRRMLLAVGHRVQSLRRVAFGPLKLGRLKVGGWRVLGIAEVDALRRAGSRR